MRVSEKKALERQKRNKGLGGLVRSKLVSNTADLDDDEFRYNFIFKICDYLTIIAVVHFLFLFFFISALLTNIFLLFLYTKIWNAGLAFCLLLKLLVLLLRVLTPLARTG